MNVHIFHNIRWSKYKAVVFSCLYEESLRRGYNFQFTQIADTDGQRAGLSEVDTGAHRYPHEVLFPGSYSAVPVWRLAAKLFSKVAASKADLIVLPGYDRFEYWAMLAAAVFRGKRRAVFCDSTLADRPQSLIKGWMKRLFFGLCDGFFAYGARSAELLQYYGAERSRIYQRCQAAALPEGYSVTQARENRVRGLMEAEAPTFLYVGRLSHEKALDVLLLAFSHVKSSLTNARLVVVGTGPRLDDLKRQARELSIEDAVLFAGSKSGESLLAHYSSATCLVLPSRSEPWGLVVNEALHYGCPVIVSDRCGCVPELVKDGVTGYSFRTDDKSDLAAKMTLLSREFDDVSVVADRCLSIIGEYTPERAASQILAGCESIMEVRRVA